MHHRVGAVTLGDGYVSIAREELLHAQQRHRLIARVDGVAGNGLRAQQASLHVACAAGRDGALQHDPDLHNDRIAVIQAGNLDRAPNLLIVRAGVDHCIGPRIYLGVGPWVNRGRIHGVNKRAVNLVGGVVAEIAARRSLGQPVGRKLDDTTFRSSAARHCDLQLERHDLAERHVAWRQ